MDAHLLSVLLWVATGGAGFTFGLLGLAATKRSMEKPVARTSSRDRRPVAVR